MEPGYFEKLLSIVAPEKCQNWEDVMSDLNNKILPGMAHWQSNNCHAYFPSQTSATAIIIGDMIASGFGTVSFIQVSAKSSEFSKAIEFIPSSCYGTRGHCNWLVSKTSWFTKMLTKFIQTIWRWLFYRELLVNQCEWIL